MSTSLRVPSTEFTRDVIGRYVCNTLEEALQSTNKNLNSEARPFDMIVIGGGSLGSALASHLFKLDKMHAHRILVLEAGPLVFTEHTQQHLWLGTPEVWGVPWSSDSPQSWNQQFPGIAFCVGGRSLFWGGWSPYLIDSEIPVPTWPLTVKQDLTNQVLQVGDERMSYQDDAARQLGTDVTNDFVNGALHFALRRTLYDHLKKRTASPILSGNRGTLMTAKKSEEELEDELEAPLAIQSTSPRPGFFPFSKFSSIQLLIRAIHMAQIEAERSSTGDLETRNVYKRLMLVNNTRVIRIERTGRRITRIVTNQGSIDVPENGKVFMAMGTIENTRMALNTLPNRHGLIGRNLMTHLCSNLTIRVKRNAYGDGLDPIKNPELQSSTLFVKGIHKFEDGSPGHFHVQITAAGVGALGMDSLTELHRKIPDIDLVNTFQDLTDDWIVLSLRTYGEMFGDKISPDPINRITHGEPVSSFDYDVPRALVRLDLGPEGTKESQLWNVMDKACNELAQVFARGGPIQYLSSQINGAWQDTPPTAEMRRTPLSSTQHEGGTLWMGENAETSVTDQWGRFHEADNLYALGSALLPTIGSVDPMLCSIALARRTADHLIPIIHPKIIEPNYENLFDGTDVTLHSWRMVGDGAFPIIDGNIIARPGADMGMLYYAPRTFGDLVLRLQFMIDRVEARAAVVVRMRDPRVPVVDRNNPNVTHAYTNQAYVGTDTGLVIQIDEMGRGDSVRGIPDDVDQNRTGAVFGIPIGTEPGKQIYHRGPILEPGKWYEYEIAIKGNTCTVRLNGQETCVLTNTDSYRGKSPEQDRYSGFIGLQCQVGCVTFRNIRIHVPTHVPMPALALEDGAIEKMAIVWHEKVPVDGGVEASVNPPMALRRRRITDLEKQPIQRRT